MSARVLLLLLLLSVAMTAVRAHRRYDHHVLGSSAAWPCPFDPRAVIHSRFQMTRNGRVLLVSPRFRPGVPFTLGTFRATTATRHVVEPEVLPLPRARRSHRVSTDGAGCLRSLVNVVDLCLDSTKDVLWLLDVGVVNTMTDGPRRAAPAKIVRLEIDDDGDEDDDDNNDDDDQKTPYQTFEIGTDAADGEDPARSCLQYILTFRSRHATGGHYAFVADAGRSSVLVLNTDTGDRGSIDFPERAAGAGASRDVMFMVIMRKGNGRAGLYTTFLSGCRLFAVDLEHVDQYATARPAVVVVGRKPFRIVVLGSDTGSRMFFRRPAENEIWTWDVNCPFHQVGFRLVSKGTDCRAPVHVAPGYDGIVFVLRNNFADYERNSTGSLGAYTLIQPVSVFPSLNCSTATMTTTPAATPAATLAATPAGTRTTARADATTPRTTSRTTPTATTTTVSAAPTPVTTSTTGGGDDDDNSGCQCKNI